MEEKIGTGDVWRANRDLKERMESSQIDIGYDAEFDMLLVTIGSAQEAITEQIDDQVYIRLDPETLKIVGLTVTAFKELFLEKEPEFKKRFAAIFERPSVMERWQVPVGEKSRSRVTDTLGELVTA